MNEGLLVDGRHLMPLSTRCSDMGMTTEMDDDDMMGDLSENMARPSEYLRGHCPLCFGGQLVHDPTSLCVDLALCLLFS